MRGRGGWRKLPFVSLVDGISISNHMAKHRNAVSVFCRVQNVAPACNAGGCSSLHTMNAAARLMQPLRCAATHLKTSQCLLQHVSNTQRTQALARQAHRTWTLLTRPHVTRSIINAAQRPVVLYITCTPAGAVASRRHAVATHPDMTRTGAHGEHTVSMWPRGGGGSSPYHFMPGDCRAKNHAAAFMSSIGRMILS
jgi:hypothetical protein